MNLMPENDEASDTQFEHRLAENREARLRGRGARFSIHVGSGSLTLTVGALLRASYRMSIILR